MKISFTQRLENIDRNSLQVSEDNCRLLIEGFGKLIKMIGLTTTKLDIWEDFNLWMEGDAAAFSELLESCQFVDNVDCATILTGNKSKCSPCVFIHEVTQKMNDVIHIPCCHGNRRLSGSMCVDCLITVCSKGIDMHMTTYAH